MSQENLELVRRCLEAWQRDDLDTWLSTLDETVEWQPAMERLIEGIESSHRGHEEMRVLWRAYRTELENFRVEAQGVRDLGDDRVLLLVHFWWCGASSGIEFDSPVGMVVTVRGGKIIQSIDYLSHREALEAAGLRE